MKRRIIFPEISACILLLLYNLCGCSVIKDISEEEHNHTEPSIKFGNFRMQKNFSDPIYHDYSKHEHEHDHEHGHEHFHTDSYHRNHLKPMPLKNLESTTSLTTRITSTTTDQLPMIFDYEATTETVPNYPFERIRKLINSNSLLKNYFNQTTRIVIGNRINNEDSLDSSESLCRTSTIRILYPKQLKNLKNEDVVLVNDEQNYTQPIEHHNCISSGQCTIPFDALGYTSYCSQQFYTTQLMVYKNDKIEFDQFKVPSCCTCRIKKV